MKIAFLGCSGYLGQKVALKLIGQGHKVLCVSVFESDRSKMKLLSEDIDFCLLDQLDSVFQIEHYDCAINTACMYQTVDSNPIQVFDANLVSPMVFFLSCKNVGIEKFITIDTSLPKEFNEYAFSKAQLAELLHWYARQDDINVCNIKLEMFYGDDEPQNRFIKRTIIKLANNDELKLTEGFQQRDIIYVDDVVNAICYIVENMPCGYTDLPLGTGLGPSIRDIVLFLKHEMNSKSNLQFGAIPMRKGEPDSIADVTKMNELGITIKDNWKSGLRKVISKYETID